MHLRSRRHRRPAGPGETPKGSLNTIYKYYGLWARASGQSRLSIGYRNLAYLHSRIAQPGGDLCLARPSSSAGARGRLGGRGQWSGGRAGRRLARSGGGVQSRYN